MITLYADCVDSALYQGLQHIRRWGEPTPSRAGPVLVAPHPVTTVFLNPTRRVSFDPIRDANPFFHLFEAIWMLSGSNRPQVLDRFITDFSSRFTEEDGHQHGAYGFRWRRHFDVDGGGSPFLPDQLNTIVQLLRSNPNDRRVVLAMWDPVADLGTATRDAPCNTHAYPRVRIASGKPVLDLTVCCRSNDLIWGCTGANAVHFSILLEYLAARIGVGIGKYYQVSNNYHAYEATLKPLANVSNYRCTEYVQCIPSPMFTVPDKIDSDVDAFMHWMEGISAYELPVSSWTYANRWFTDTGEALLEAHWHWKAKNYVLAMSLLRNDKISSDWACAARAWVSRRLLKKGIKL